MKVALFIIKDQPYIQYQVVKFIEKLKFIGLNNEDVIIIQKTTEFPKRINEYKYIKRNFIKKLLIGFNQCILVKIHRIFFNKIIASRYSNLDIKKYSIKFTNSDETKKMLEENRIDITIFIYYGEIVKREILNITKVNLNVHVGMLPDFRGYRTLIWQLFYKQPFYVLTLHKMNERIDEGDIVFELPYKIKPGRSLHYGHVKSTENIHLLLLMGLRRLFMFDLDFGIGQEKYKGEAQYFKGV